jgi:hypothetical protein
MKDLLMVIYIIIYHNFSQLGISLRTENFRDRFDPLHHNFD